MRSDAIKAALLALFAGTATLGKPAPAGDVASRNHALPFLGHDVSSLLMMERDLKCVNHITIPSGVLPACL
jgi:hypothetical protein